MADVGGILRCLADLSPRGAERLDVTTGDFAWLGTEHWPFGATAVGPDLDVVGTQETAIRHRDVHALAQLDAIHGALPILRMGWVYLSATVPRPDGPKRVLLPLVDRPVRLRPLRPVRPLRPPPPPCPRRTHPAQSSARPPSSATT